MAGAGLRIATGLATLAALALAPGQAQAAAGATSGSSVEILQTIQYAVLLDMNFGNVASTGQAGIIDLNPASNSRNCDPTVVCVGGYATSELRLTGSDANVVVTYNPNFFLTGPGDPMLAEAQFPGGSGAIVHLTGGQATVRFGARLHVNANQAPGTYSGTFAVNLEYY